MKLTGLTALALVLTLAACGEEEADKTVAKPVEKAQETATQAVTPAREPGRGAEEAVTQAAGATLYTEVAGTGGDGPLMGDAPLGAEDAGVTVIEYASLTCGHCAAFHTGTYPEFKKQYVDTGKVRMIYRDFPLDQMALAGAMVARCDGSPQKYHAFVDLLLRQQSKWTRAENVIDELRRMAKLGGLSDEQVDACFANEALGQSVLDRAREAQAEFGINSTPSFIIDGELHSGSMTLAQMSAIIDPLLE